MHETRRLVEAASALSIFLQTRGIPHAFYGDALISLLAGQSLAGVSSEFVPERQTFLTTYPPPQQISCIVQGGAPHPFRLVRDALRSAEDFSITSSPWSDRYEAAHCPRLVLCPNHHSSLQSTRKIPPFHPSNRSKSGNAYSPARIHSYPGSLMRSRSFLRGKKVHAASMPTR